MTDPIGVLARDLRQARAPLTELLRTAVFRGMLLAHISPQWAEATVEAELSEAAALAGVSYAALHETLSRDLREVITGADSVQPAPTAAGSCSKRARKPRAV